MPWYHGNLHCHSTNSDGDSAPAEVARFYRQHGFSFVAITDHDRRTGPEDCGPVEPGFAVLGACETGLKLGDRPLHVNGIGATSTVPGNNRQVSDAAAGMQGVVDAFRAQGGFTILNHPNWCWGFSTADLLAVRGAHAFELWNGAHDSDNLGDAAHPGTEAMWDAALSAGHRLWAVASDDCHHFGPKRSFRSDPPFTGWVAVECDLPEPAQILAALKSGRFYASMGPRIETWEQSASGIRIVANPKGRHCRIVFIGAGGRELSSTSGREASYVPRGDEGYIRCRVEGGMGLNAWTQPMFLV